MATLPSRFTAFVAATLLLIPAAPALAIQPIVPVDAPVSPAADATPVAAPASTPATGTASSTSVPVSVTVGDVPIQLGVTALTASTETLTPIANGTLTLADIAGAKLGELKVSSNGTNTTDGAVLNEDTVAGPVTLIAGQLSARVDETTGTATAALQRLDIAVELLEGLGIGTSIDGASALVGPTNATATHGLQITDIDLSLGSLLGDVLGELPLDVLVDLAGELGITIPADLSAADDVLAATEALIAAVAEAATTSDAVTDAAAALADAELLDPIAAYGDPATYEALLSDIADAVTLFETDPGQAVLDLIAVLADGDLIALDCDLFVVVPTVLTLEQIGSDAATCVQAQLDAIAAAVDALQDELTALTDAVSAYADAVADALAAAAVLDGEGLSLEDVLAAVLDLIDSLEGTSLLNLSGFGVDQQAIAVADHLAVSSATSTCDTTTLQVVLLPPVEIDTCDASEIDAVLAAVDSIVATISGVLDTVGIIDLGDGVSLKILDEVVNGVTKGTDGRVTAVSSVEVLRLNIPEITVDPCAVADGLVCALGLDLLSPVLDLLPDLGATLDDAQATVEGALATAIDALDALGAEVDVLDEVGAGDIVQAVADALIGILDGLDLGNLGAAQGVTLPGALIVVDPQVSATHLPGVTAAGGSPDPAGDPDPNGGPGSGPGLPNTGGGAAVLALLALGGAFALRRKAKSGADD